MLQFHLSILIIISWALFRKPLPMPISWSFLEYVFL
jgi:hypothetical protein